jgi:hypothetical protein
MSGCFIMSKVDIDFRHNETANELPPKIDLPLWWAEFQRESKCRRNFQRRWAFRVTGLSGRAFSRARDFSGSAFSPTLAFPAQFAFTPTRFVVT